jgi:hypothetical protein
MAAAAVLAAEFASAQVSLPTNVYYVALGDSVAAGDGAHAVTNGYAYRLYQQGTFGSLQATEFSNAALRAARSWELLSHQVPQVLCAEPVLRPTVVTITAGANDFFRNDTNIVGIASRVAESINLLLNNDTGLLSTPVLDPITMQPCRALDNVTILVSNYYRIPHPDPAIDPILDAALSGFDQALRFWLQFVTVPPGSRLAVVDLYAASEGKEGLVMIERRNGYQGPFAFDAHPTNLGHSFIAQQFEAAWRQLE